MEENIENQKTEVIDNQLSDNKKTKCIMPSKMLLLINGILLIGLIILYVLFFNKNTSKEIKQNANSSDIKIAYVDTDSLRANYIMVKEMRDTLELSFEKLEKDMKQRQASFEARAREFQNKINSNTITMEQAQKTEQQLMAEQQNILELKDKYTNDLAEQEYLMNERFVDSVYNFLKRYNTSANFEYILGYTKGAGILFAEEKLNITNLVIEGLNNEYSNVKK